MGTASIGEVVIKLRNSCTGHWPVHLFQKLNGVAAGACPGRGAARFGIAPAPASRGDRGGSVGPDHRRFLPAAKRRAAVACADRRRFRRAADCRCSAPRASMGSTPTNIASPPFRARSRPRAAASARQIERADRALSAGVRRLCPRSAHRSRASGSPTSIPSLRPGAAVRAGGAARGGQRAVAARICRVDGLDAPVLRRSFAKPSPSTNIATTTSASCCRSTSSARGRCPAARRATCSSTPPSSGSTCTRRASRSIRWWWSSASRNSRRRC